MPGTRGTEDSRIIRRITGIILGVLVFFLVYWITGLGTPSNPNWALAALIGLVVALIWPWLFGLIMVSAFGGTDRARSTRKSKAARSAAEESAVLTGAPVDRA